ncbi:transglutaminase-like cysteine peptidase [Allopontixanthobacter sp.]|uniref:transglutaminase-like cysteine peptidase n=1 Tax=Allopontixanthobacter sp. TaxID=2906452 RepID=UPI002ABB6B5F|nr:transglutaminase-like cysteine peptidase [Allopontixanthobacter sp.]MDZ4307781.1 transglutaminase-like cysteine peptidase [Allopontixanthobacter sp.]
MKNRIFSERLTRSLYGLGMVGAALAISPSTKAQVAMVGVMLPASASAVVMASCQFQADASGPGSLAANVPSRSKAGAIVGSGAAMSALERMIQAQSGQAVTDVAFGANGSTATIATSSLALPPSQCLGQFGSPFSGVNPAATVMAPATDFLASKRIKISNTSLEADWRRVNSGQLSSNWASRQLGAGKRSEEELVQAVNAYANRAIRYAEDRDLWGKADYWANAKTTFRLGQGDCEDIAIAKMQMLAALGIKREDMILTLARDLIRGADHAVLIVRLGGQFVMLDNTTDKLIDASQSQGYRPILSFGSSQSWIHGF